MEDVEDIRLVMQEADCLVSGARVEQVLDVMAAEISAVYQDANPIILSVMRGGIIVCAKLLERLQFPLELDYIHATRYQEGIEGGEQIEWRALPGLDVKGRDLLLVDDILDVGVTLKAILAAPELRDAKSVRTAVLLDKQHNRKIDPNFKADFTGMMVEDRYVFGYGMDYKGYLRNAPGIYAVKGL